MSDKYSSWKARNDKHDENHISGKPRRFWKEDFSCDQCYPYMMTNKKFIRFWKCYQQIVPEVQEKGYSGKTEEIFTEYLTLGGEFDIRKHDKNTQYRLNGKIGKLLGSIRYNKIPKITEKEIRQKLIELTVASEKFEKSVQKTLELWEKYTSSEAEGYSSESSILSSENEDYPDNWYEEHEKRKREHDEIHLLETPIKEEIKTDISCRKCMPISRAKRIEDEEFQQFWKWYKKLTLAETYSGMTIALFIQLKAQELNLAINRIQEIKNNP